MPVAPPSPDKDQAMDERNWFDQLAASLTEAGCETHQFATGDGRLMVTTQGARVLACEMPGIMGNAFWHNPALADPDRARGAVDGGGGGFGGDRLWIAPEVGFVFTDLAKARVDPLGNQKLPPEMDPAKWEALDRGPESVRMATAMSLSDHRTGRRVELEAERIVEPISPPGSLTPGVAHVGFALSNELRLIDADHGAVAGAWDLLQVAPTGTLHCPTTLAGASPRSYYDPFGERHVEADADGVRFLIDGKRRVKMGLPAEHVVGRMAFYRPQSDGERALAVLRLFAPHPGEPYVDVPRDSDETFGGDCFQAYNHREGIGHVPPFGEMEYHDPALIGGSGPRQRIGRCTTHVFTGEDEAIKRAVEPMLGMELRCL